MIDGRRLMALGAVPSVRRYARLMTKAEELFIRASMEQPDVGPRNWSELTHEQQAHWVAMAREDLGL